MMRGYSGYTAPGYLAGEKSYPAPPHHLLSLLSPEALTGLLERIQAGGGLGGVSRMGQGERSEVKLTNPWLDIWIFF